MTKSGGGTAFAVDLVALCIFFLFLSGRGVVVVHHPYYCLGTNKTVILVFFCVCLFVCVYNSTRCILLFVCFISFHFICVIFGLLCACHRIYVTRESAATQISGWTHRGCRMVAAGGVRGGCC